MRNGVELQNMQIVGTTEDFHLVREIPIVMGRFFSRFEAEKGTRITVIGWDIYERLFPGGEDPLNGYVEIDGIPFRVIGVIEKQGNLMTNMSGMAADYNAYIPLPAANKMFGRWRGITIMASAPSEDLVDDLEQELRMAVRAVRGIKPGEADNFGINKQDFFLTEFRNATKYMWAALIGIAALSLLVGGIGVMNIMLISVTERTREIGVRKALGAKRRNILLQFLLEALIVCWSGGLIGAIIGFFMSAIIAAVSPLVFVFSWPAVALGTAFTSAIGIFFGLYPAIKAARKSPVEALRYE
ncbi:MAG TPA: FtsX-like permease family protein [candidate division Zixibacteria bacterium]|nr:FtsX-like permease family protein [candidate division Zixibacteria bacterium]